MTMSALPPDVERRLLGLQWAIAVFAFVGILTFPFPGSVGGRSVVAVALVAYALMRAVKGWARRAAMSKPASTQTVVVPWEWTGEPGDAWSCPIFGHMELPWSLGALGPRRRELGLPAPGGDIINYSFVVLRPGNGRLCYRFQDGEASQLVPLVRGFNVVQLRRADEPTGRQL